MSDLGAFFGPNAGYVLELYDRFQADPTSVDDRTRAYFETLSPPSFEPDGQHAAPSPPSLPSHSSSVSTLDVTKIGAVVGLANAIREYGHLAVQLDPLGSEPPGSPELEVETYGITDEDLKAIPAEAVGGDVPQGSANAYEAIQHLRNRYSRAVGFEFDHVQVAEERQWLHTLVETGEFDRTPSEAEQKQLLNRLSQVEVFERFLHQTYLGQKRFSIEGSDVLIPMLDQVIDDAATEGSTEVLMGMAHRGRLNVMTHILNKPYGAIISAFEGGQRRGSSGTDSGADVRTGDVKYHLGARLAQNKETGERQKLPIVLAPNPSHLESVNPVVLGMTRAAQDDRTHPGKPTQDERKALSILLHGDAAFPGQGVVAESLNLSGLDGYSVGGTVHIIVNNQIGYTTDWGDSRSTLYAGDLAKGFEIPVIHVNADDPEACLMAARIAMAYRKRFHKDFLIDLVGYRRWGHNEGDEPAFTQPLMYRTISKHPTVRKIWADKLEAAGVVTRDETQAAEQKVLDRLTRIRRGITEGTETFLEEEPPLRTERREVETAVPLEALKSLHDGIHALPETFTANGKIKRQWDRRAAVLNSDGDGKIDWAHAESLAFAATLADGVPIRLTGQDAERGTFSQRHLAFHDAKTGEPHIPLDVLPEAKASFAVYNSPLSENAAMGFEYGYSVHAMETLVLWEAQFGDFVNGAQVVIDQYLASSRSKWGQEPTLVLLLPHGYEGQGPEHSSARLERFLQLSAQDNIRVANTSTSAQYFHLLRRQALRLEEDPRPLILMTPKRLLRHSAAASPVEDLASGTFRPVLDDPRAADRRDAVTRLIFCSGQVSVDLDSADARDTTPEVAVARVEQLAPFQTTAIRNTIANYPNLQDIVWVQEEPKNMGAWSYMGARIQEIAPEGVSVRYVGRPERASPAVGSGELHKHEQAAVVTEAFADVQQAAKAAANGRVSAKTAKSKRAKASASD